MNVPFLDIKTQYIEIRKKIETQVLEVLNSCDYIGGSYVENFEHLMEEYLEVSHVAGCSNGTDALILGLRACNIKPGDEVITTPFSFFATAEAIASIGAVPVFVDIKESDYNIDSSKIESAITSKTKAILPVHIFGAPCDMDAINQIANRHKLKVVEDDAQAIGSEYKGKKVGGLGDVGCFSFYPTKNLGGVGDGGMVTTNSDELYTILLALKVHGSGKNGARALNYLEGIEEEVNTNETETELYNPYKYYNYLIGYNSRLDAIQAAVLSIKLNHLDDYNTKREKVAAKYLEGLTDKVICPIYSKDIKPCWHQFAIRVKHKEELCAYLTEHGIGNGSFYPIPLHKQKAFCKNTSSSSTLKLPIAEKVATQTVCLPIYPGMTGEQIDYVIETVNRFYKGKTGIER